MQENNIIHKDRDQPTVTETPNQWQYSHLVGQESCDPLSKHDPLTMADLIQRLQHEVTVPSGASAPPTMARTRRLRVYCSEGSWDSL